MLHNVYKTIGLTIIALFLVFVITAGIILLAGFPKYNPDKTLEIEGEVADFFNKVTLPIKLARLSWLPADQEILMPVYGIRAREITDSWMAPRPEERYHEGQDIFANLGTPVFSGTNGYITRLGEGNLGGLFVYIAGAGSRRYYYAHFNKIAEGLSVGQKVTTDTVIGFVGNTGNAENPPYHLHFGVYILRKAINPLPLIINRP